MTVTEITSLEQFNSLIGGDGHVAIDFWAEWCGPCRMISPVFEQLSEKTPVECYKVNVDVQGEISEKAGISHLPTFVLYHKGEIVDKLVGAKPPALQELLNKAA